MTYTYRQRTPEDYAARFTQQREEDDDEKVVKLDEERLIRRPTGSGYTADGRRGDSDAAVGFLERLPPPWQLLAITPDPASDPQTGRNLPIAVAAYTRSEGARRFIDRWQGVRNLYFAINCLKPGVTTKADKSEISHLLMLHTDIDVPKRQDSDLAMAQADILERLKGHQPPPSVIIASGGGYWGLWLLREPVAVRDAAHADDLALYNLALAQALGGDTSARDISRIARLPGTINLPNKAKRDAGRQAALAKLVAFDPARVYTLDEFTPAAAASGERKRSTGTSKRKDPRDSGGGSAGRPYISAELREIIALGRDPHNPQRWLKENGDFDRNRAVYYVAHELARSGWTREEVAAELLDRRNRIADHIYAQADPERAVWGEDRVLDKAFKALEGEERPGDRHAREQPAADDDTRSPTICPVKWQGKSVPELEFVIDGWLPTKRVTGLYGGSGHGKTNIAQQLMTAMSLDQPFLGVEELKTNFAVSLGVLCENDEEETHRTQHFANEHYGCSMSDLRHMHLKPRLGMDNVLVGFTRDGNIDIRPFYYELREEALDLKAKLIVIDTIADVFDGNENDRAQVRKFGQQAMGGLARDTGAAVLLLGRPSLSGQSEGRAGSTEWGGVFRAGWFLNKPAEDDPDLRELIRNRASYASSGKHTAIVLRWSNGLFIPDSDAAKHKRSCEDMFLRLFDTFWRSNRPLSVSSFARELYAPTAFANQPREARGGYSKRQFAAAMEVLLLHEFIKSVKQDPSTGEIWRSPRLVRCKPGWFTI